MKNKMAIICVVALALFSCKKEPGAPSNDFPVNETFASELISQGIPSDIARFFAAVRTVSRSPDDTTCVYQQTFPNGATRDITLKVSPNRQYRPTPDEIAHTTAGRIPIYDFHYTSGIQVDGTTKIEMDYFVADPGFQLGTGMMQNVAGNTGSDGFGLSWWESAKTGADVGIGSLIDFYKDKGIPVGPIGVIYGLASALSSVTGALDLSKQNNQWLSELDALENCAANPTNAVAKSDPNYSATAVAQVQSARAELKEVNSVRFLNMMNETGSGLTPATAILSIGLKQGFLYGEQTLNDYSENTIMREARLAVVPCGDPETLEGYVNVDWDCTDSTPTQVDHEVWHSKSKVKWIPGLSPKLYTSQGTITYDYVKTWSAGGKTCTDTKTFTGNLDGAGSLMIIDDPAAQQILGYGYLAGGEINVDLLASYSCPGTVLNENLTIGWLPPITGYAGAGGMYEGEMTNPSCVGNSSKGTIKVKWSFFVPGLK